MENTPDHNIDDETIRKIGLRPADESIKAQIATDARIFNYPFLEDVYIMENDLYGNKMPKDSCFLAFTGQHGLVGKHLKIETLKSATIKDIKDIVASNREG